MLLIDKNNRYTANKLVKSIIDTEIIGMKKKIKILKEIEHLSKFNCNADDMDPTCEIIADLVINQISVSESNIKIMLIDECKR